MRACVYVDAFNLYYGCLKNSPFRWLDISLLCQNEMPGLQFKHFHIFTARVSNRPSDPSVATRQQMYFRALQTTPNLTIHWGRYVENATTMPLVKPVSGASPFVRVLKTEEKGSDVNLASHLLLGAFRSTYDIAIVISNDTDLKEPIRIVTEEFRKPVIVLAPLPAATSKKKRYVASDLRSAATFTLPIDHTSLPKSQFPSTMQDAHGIFTKPSSW